MCQNKVVVDTSDENRDIYVKSHITNRIDGNLEHEIEQMLPGVDEGEIVVIRSKKRKRSISAFRQGGKIIISIPARLTKAEERQVVPEMVAKIRAKEVAPDELELSELVD